MQHRTLCAAAAALLASFPAAQDLKIGDPAPALKIAKWVKGEPVEMLAPGKTYVVEFWATWCGPCIASMPHLSQLQKEYADRGLTIIGVTSEDDRNSLEAVEAMVKEKGDGMGYTVAWDDDGATKEAYMEAANQRGIPCSFLVDQKGNLAYIGHPMMLDFPLPRVVAGKWDPIEGKKEMEALDKRLRAAMKSAATDPEKGATELTAMVEEHPFLAGMVNDSLYQMHLAAGRHEKAYEIAGAIVDKAIATGDAQKLNEVAWGIVDPQADVEQRDLDLAQRAAEKAVELTNEKDGAILDTLARVWFWKNDLAKAIELQEKAVKLDPRPDLGAALEEYRKAAGGAKAAEGAKASDASGKKGDGK